jgi:hypothetical protein
MEFLRRATTVAAFRDRWQVTDPAALGPDSPGDLARANDRRTAAEAILAAREVAFATPDNAVRAVNTASREPLGVAASTECRRSL